MSNFPKKTWYNKGETTKTPINKDSLNDLENRISEVIDSTSPEIAVESSVISHNYSCQKKNSRVVLNFGANIGNMTNSGQWIAFATMPAEFRPTMTIYVTGFVGSNTPVEVSITRAGQVSYWDNQTKNNANLRFNATFDTTS